MKKVISIILGVVLLVIVGVGARYFLAYNGFLDKITERKPEMKQYNVIVSEDSKINNEKDLVDKSVGFLKTDPKAANAGQKLNSEVEVEID